MGPPPSGCRHCIRIRRLFAFHLLLLHARVAYDAIRGFHVVCRRLWSNPRADRANGLRTHLPDLRKCGTCRPSLIPRVCCVPLSLRSSGRRLISNTRSQSPRARSSQVRGKDDDRVSTPSQRSPSPYSRSAQAWEGALSSVSLALLYQSCGQYNVDVGMLFSQYATGAAEMSASQFYQFAWDAQLIDNSADVDNFFLMAVGSHYRGSLRISPDRFNAALVRVFENLASQRTLDLARACDVVVRDHITPIVAERAVRGGFHPGFAALNGPSLGGPPAYGYGAAPAAIAMEAAAGYGPAVDGYNPMMQRGPMRAAERLSNGRMSPRRR